MIRFILAAFFSFLLLGLQHETLVHGYQHDGARMALGGKAAVQSAADGLCVTCALIAGGTHGVASSQAPWLDHPVAFAAPASSHSSHVALAPVYYSSRAPPVLSL